MVFDISPDYEILRVLFYSDVDNRSVLPVDGDHPRAERKGNADRINSRLMREPAAETTGGGPD
jgi:hypothetical protein